MIRYLAPALLLAAPTLAAQADLAVLARASTLGVGIEASKLVTGHVAVRAGYGRLSHSISRSKRQVNYDIDIRLEGFSGLVDFYPGGRSKFHFTVGAITAPAEVDGTGRPRDGSYTFNDREYTAAEVGTASASLRWPGTMPYLGLGFGSPAREQGGFAVFLDIGAAIGTPTFDLSASSALAGSSLDRDVAAERERIQRDVDRYGKVYPVISLGLGIRF